MTFCINHHFHNEHGAIVLETALLLPVYLIVLGFGLWVIDYSIAICKHSTFSYAHLALFSDWHDNASDTARKYVFGGRQSKDTSTSEATHVSGDSTWMVKNQVTSRVAITEEELPVKFLSLGKRTSERNVTIASATLSNYARTLRPEPRNWLKPQRIGDIPIEKGVVLKINPYTLKNVTTTYDYWLNNIKFKGGFWNYCKNQVMEDNISLIASWIVSENEYTGWAIDKATNDYFNDNYWIYDSEYNKWKADEYKKKNKDYFDWEKDHPKTEPVITEYLYETPEYDSNPYQVHDIGQNPHQYQEVPNNEFKYKTLLSKQTYLNYQQGYWDGINYYNSLINEGNIYASWGNNWGAAAKWTEANNYNERFTATWNNNYNKYKSDVEANNKKYNQREAELKAIRAENEEYAQWEQQAESWREENSKHNGWEQEHTIDLITEMRVSLPVPEMIHYTHLSRCGDAINLRLFH